MRFPHFIFSVVAAALVSSAFGEAVKDREGAVRKDRATMEGDARWIYADVARGFAEAKRTGKPLLVVLRCVPCVACMGIDAGVLSEPALAPVLDRFVCVRVIDANAMDLALFQFDYDLSFSTLFFNGDGTIYGRYGSWTHQKNAQDTDTASFRHALDAALAIHGGYPPNKPTLAGKQGVPVRFKTPVEMPTLAGKYQPELDWQGKVVASCVHCHQVGDAFRASFRERGEAIPEEWIYPQPAPETIGLTLAPDQIARVETVAAGSIAERAGVRGGDEFVSLAGQPLVSIADVSWALHRAPESGALAAVLKRDGAEKAVTFTLPAEWRRHTDISRRVAAWHMRGMATGGLVLEDLSDAERTKRGLGADVMALFVKHVGLYGKHAAAKNAGFQKEDVIVSLGTWSARISEGEALGQLLQKHHAGEKLATKVLRGGQQIELSLPMQ